MTPDDAQRLHEAYHEARRRYVDDPENGLIPWPKRRVKRKPEPGALTLADEENG